MFLKTAKLCFAGLLLIHLPHLIDASCVNLNITDCTYTIVCPRHAGAVQAIPSCNQPPNVTFAMINSEVDLLTKAFFKSTNFDSRVRHFVTLNSTAKSIDSNAFSYYTKLLSIDLSYTGINSIKDLAFKNLPQLIYLNLSHNSISTLSRETFTISDTPELKILDLSFNLITKLDEAVFYLLSNLKILFLNNNLLHVILDDMFIATKSLITLNLAFNRLTSFNASLTHLNVVQDLDISHNLLTKMPGFEFNRLVNLKNINASNNLIYTVESNCFNQAFNLESLDLSNNRINSTIDNVLLLNNVKLNYLNFFNNCISVIQDNTFKYNVLNYMNIEKNNISVTIGENTFVGLKNITNLNLYGQSIKQLNNGAFSDLISLQKLNLSNNLITDIENGTFKGASTLEILDLSNNYLKTVYFLSDWTNVLTELYLNENDLTDIPSKSFNSQKNLILLDLSQNKISTIEPFSLPLTLLQYLKLRGNNLSKTLKRDVISPAKFLRYIDLSNHSLEKIDEYAIVDMPLLTKFNISNNKLTYIDSNNFQGLTNLYNLDLSCNQLLELTLNNSLLSNLQGLILAKNNLSKFNNVFSTNMTQLIYLDLSDNSISNFSNVNLDSMYNLKVLKLSNNNIEEFKYGSIDKLVSLNILLLAHNNLSQLNITNFKELKQLDISNNKFTYINNTFFKSNANLVSLDFSSNNISKIEPGIFINLKRLQFLNASSNFLNTFRYGTFKGLINTSLIDLSDNKINKLDMTLFHECISLKTLIVDFNYIKHLELSHLSEIVPTLRELSLGGNMLQCKEIINNIRALNNNKGHIIDIKSIKEIHHDDNVHGIKCISNVTTEEDSEPKNDYPEHYHLSLLVWTTVLTAVVLLIVGMYFYRKYRIHRSVMQFQSSVEMNGSDF